MFLFFSGFAQNYYIAFKQGYSFEPIQKTVNNDSTLALQFNNNTLTNFFSNKQVYYFEKAFPTAQTEILQRVYKVKLDNGSFLNEINSLEEVEYAELTGEDEIGEEELLYTPNDFFGVEDANPSAQLDLIKARQAWNITQGDPNIIVGIVDTEFDSTHEDLVNQILQDIDDVACTSSIGFCDHGTRVAGFVAAQTDNGKGIAGIGFNIKMITMANGNNLNNVLLLSQIPGVRIINTSWLSSCSFILTHKLVLDEIWENGVIVVSAAGNGGTCGGPTNYVYPASYEHTISVSTVGHKFCYGDSGLTNWKDVHEKYLGDVNSTHQHNDKVDVVAPGYNVTTTSILEESNGYLDYANGTSYSSPMVAGVIGLMLSANPNLTPNEIKEILKNTADDIYHIPENAPYVGLLGAGRVNAYRAVKTAQCMITQAQVVDLAMQNSVEDSFVEPDENTEYLWQSEDIWVRNQNDGVLHYCEHQNPEYDPNNPNYVYVRVTNNGCQKSSPLDELQLYWAKANTSLSWPQHWDGSLYINDPVTGQDVLMGDIISTVTIPALESGESTILEIPWMVPNPEDYQNINSNPWHFCLLARIKSTDDPISFPEGLLITENVKNNNNIVWKNTSVVDILPNNPSPIGGTIAVGNPFTQQKAFTLELVKDANEQGKAVFEEAEVALTMDDILYNAWVEGGEQGQRFIATKVLQKKIVTGDTTRLENIVLDSGETGTLYVSFNFLTKELTDKQNFTYHVIQRDALTNEIIGGETYLINKQVENTFTADAGNDKTIDKNETVTITAQQINQDAVYNWYDPDGNLIYTGTDLTVSPDVTNTYKLEIISTIDGFKDYDQVQVTVNPYKIESLIPNPADNVVTVNYLADEATSAYLIVTNTNSGGSNNYILDTSLTVLNIDVSSYQPGIYTITLVCDGEVQSSKSLIKN